MMDNKGPMGSMADMMSKMMSGVKEVGMPMMEMMGKMMPQGLAMMLGQMPKEQRLEFVRNRLTAQGLL